MADDDKAAARRVRELFKGRFDQETALKLLQDFGGENAAVDFVLNENPEVVQQFFRKSESYVKSLTTDAKRLDDILENGIEFNTRQFACGACTRSWWKKVPIRKEVSKCFRCKLKYDPVPKENEWGWGKFNCHCGNEFNGFAEMGVTTCPCYQCGMIVPVESILPPRRRIGQRKSRAPHSCNGVNCYNPVCGPSQNIHLGAIGGNHYNKDSTFVTNVLATGPTVSPDYGARGANVSAAGAANGGQARGKKNAPQRQSGPGAPGAYPNQASTTQAVCCHPRSARPTSNTLRTVSNRHLSTGSSVTTFLSQGSLDVRSDAVPRIPATIPE